MEKQTEEYMQKATLLHGEGSIIEPQIEFLQELLKGHGEILRIGETGFNLGISAATFLGARPDIMVVSFDWLRYPNTECYPPPLMAKRIIDGTFPGQHTLIVGDSQETLPAFRNLIASNFFDMLFIDGGHIWPVPYNDIINLFPLLKVGGLIVVDDYCEDYGSLGVMRAWDTFAEKKLVRIDGTQPYQYRNRAWMIGTKIEEL